MSNLEDEENEETEEAKVPPAIAMRNAQLAKAKADAEKTDADENAKDTPEPQAEKTGKQCK